MSDGFVSGKELESLIGHLNHAVFVPLMSRHFLNRLRFLFKRSKRSQKVMLPHEALKDLTLWLEFLATAHAGMPINLVVDLSPELLNIIGSCENVSGGFSVSRGELFVLKHHHVSVFAHQTMFWSYLPRL